MATASHQLQQQRPILEARIKQLVNNDLKEICRAHNYQVSGNKANLQARCIEILQKIIADNNQTAFDRFNHQINNHGQDPSWHLNPSHIKPQDTSYSNSPAASNPHAQHSRPWPTQGRSAVGRLPPSGRLFKPSPFYEVLENVLPFDFLPEFPQNRNTVNATLRLKEDAVRRLAGDSTLRLLLYCGADTNLTPSSPPIDISFPGQIEVKINGDDVRSNFKGLKNKPGSTKPADITDKVRRNTGYGNIIAITYALTSKQFMFGVQLARYCDAATLTERIKLGRFIPKQVVLDEMNKANSDPDIATTSIRMSLKDPVSTMRITLPIRSDRCAHNQCFDGSMFMQLQEQAPQWLCPVCNRTVFFESLRVDKYFEDILNRTTKSTEKVDIEPNGEWRVIDAGDNAKDNAPRGPRAAYDDDFDDDDDFEIVEVKDEPRSATLPNGSLARSWTLPAISQTNTPPLSSRETSITQTTTQGTKRPANSRPSAVMPTVIDLCSSDEEDEPVRPAKRRLTSTQFRPPAPSTTNTSTTSTPVPSSHNTPASIPVAPPSVNQQQTSSRYAAPTSAPAATATEYPADPFRQSEAVPTALSGSATNRSEAYRSNSGEGNVGSSNTFFARYARNSDPFGNSNRSQSPSILPDSGRGINAGQFGNYRDSSRLSKPPGQSNNVDQNISTRSHSFTPRDDTGGAPRADHGSSSWSSQNARQHSPLQHRHRSPQGPASASHSTPYSHQPPRGDAHQHLHSRPATVSSSSFGLPPQPPLSAPPSHPNSSSYQPPPPQSTHQNHNSTARPSRDDFNDVYGDSYRDATMNGNSPHSRSPPRGPGANTRDDWWSRTGANKSRRDPWERGGGWSDRRDFSDSSNDSQRSRPHRQSSFHNTASADSLRAPADSPFTSRNTHERTHNDHPRLPWPSDDDPRTHLPPSHGSSTSNPNTSYPHQRPLPAANNSPHQSSTSPKTRIFSLPPPPPPPSHRPPGPRGADPPYPVDDELGRPPPSSQNWR